VISDVTGLSVHVSEELGMYAGAWDRLVEGMPIPSPFLRSWWLSTAAGSRPRIAMVLQGERLLGGLALERDRHLGVERLRVLGAGVLCPDHLDAVSAPDLRDAVASALSAWLGRPGDRLIDLDGVVGDSLVVTVLPGRVRRERSAVAPYEVLASGYMEARSPSFRRIVHRAELRLQREAGACVAARVDDIDAGLRLLRSLHAQRWRNRSAFLGEFRRFERVCRAAAAQGEVAVYALRAGDETVAVTASFEVAGRISYYQSGRNPARRWRNAATVLLARVFDDAARCGLREADLLRGDEEYKSGFASGRRELWRLRCATGPRSAVALRVDLAVERGRHVLSRARRRLRAS
jgi:CelD/BcsL family acetyltransferase involved in cellulose biosynthesis